MRRRCRRGSPARFPTSTIAENVKSGITIDQVIANKIGQDSPLPSLELATEDFTGWIGGCDTAYSCAYMNTDLVEERDDAAADGNQPADRVRAALRAARHGAAARCADARQQEHPRLGARRSAATCRRRSAARTRRGSATTWTTSARSKQRIQKAEKSAATSQTVPDAPIGIPDTFDEHAGLMYDLAAVAFEANLTRVFTFMKSRDASQRVLSEHRRQRAPPRDVASREQPGQDRGPREAQHLLHEPVREVPAEAQVDARRRRHACSITR